MLLQKYLKEHKITANLLHPPLLYRKVKGTGPRAMAGKIVKVNYKALYWMEKYLMNPRKNLTNSIGSG